MACLLGLIVCFTGLDLQVESRVTLTLQHYVTLVLLTSVDLFDVP